MRRNDPIYLAKYAHDNNLIKNPGWKELCRYAKNTKNMNRLLKDDKSNQQRSTVKINFGVNIIRDHKETMMFDYDNGNTNWKDADLLELKLI